MSRAPEPADLVTVRAAGPFEGIGGYVERVDGDQVLVRFGGFLPQTFAASDLEVYDPPRGAELKKLRWREVLDDIDECLEGLSPEEREELALLFRKTTE